MTALDREEEEARGTDVVDLPQTSTASADLVAALGALDDLRRDKTAKVETKGGGSYSYAYTDLAGVLGAVRPVLAAHRFAVIQPVETFDTLVRVWTELVHVTGERFPSPALSMRQPDGAQALGSAITYLRRYSLLAALGLATEDDDAKAASAAPARQTRPRASGPVDETARRTRHAMALFRELGLGARDDRLQITSAILGREVASWADVSPVEANRVIAELVIRRDEQNAADGEAARWDADAEEVDHAGY